MLWALETLFDSGDLALGSGDLLWALEDLALGSGDLAFDGRPLAFCLLSGRGCLLEVTLTEALGFARCLLDTGPGSLALQKAHRHASFPPFFPVLTCWPL